MFDLPQNSFQQDEIGRKNQHCHENAKIHPDGQGVAVNMGIDGNAPQKNSEPDQREHGLISFRIGLGDQKDRQEAENQARAGQRRKGLGQVGCQFLQLKQCRDDKKLDRDCDQAARCGIRFLEQPVREQTLCDVGPGEPDRQRPATRQRLGARAQAENIEYSENDQDSECTDSTLMMRWKTSSAVPSPSTLESTPLPA
jgi:hypothetical protein